MVASPSGARIRRRRRVSIPFIAGQWSLLLSSPLAARRGRARVSIPFIAGQWSLLRGAAAALHAHSDVSIPFIAGQWSLLGGRVGHPLAGSSCLNPLHCGAVVASSRCARAWARCARLNPLHCGAVVASFELPPRRTAGAGKGLNPLHCGAVVASRNGRNTSLGSPGSQSPSLRGSGRFGILLKRPPRRKAGVSIPFIAGQWSLPRGRAPRRARARRSQSPSLRGSGRFSPRSTSSTP